MAREWKTLMDDTTSYAGKISLGELAVVEALRAIAEELHELNKGEQNRILEAFVSKWERPPKE